MEALGGILDPANSKVGETNRPIAGIQERLLAEHVVDHKATWNGTRRSGCLFDGTWRRHDGRRALVKHDPLSIEGARDRSHEVADR